MFINFSLHAVYILVFENEYQQIGAVKNFLSIDLQERAYHDVLMKYDYPQCLALPKEKIYDDLFGSDSDLVDKLINKELKEIHPNLRCLWIPTTLWELFVLYNYFSNDEFREYVNQIGNSCGMYDKTADKLGEHKPTASNNSDSIFFPDIDDKILAILENPQKTKEDLYAEYNKYNHNPDICKYFLKLSNDFVNFIKKNSKILDSNCLNEFLLLDYLPWIEMFPRSVDEWRTLGFPFSFHSKDHPEFEFHMVGIVEVFNQELMRAKLSERLISRIIEEEVAARKMNRALIFRGAPIESISFIDDNRIDLLFLPFLIEKDKSEKILRLHENCESFSLSYGNSFLGGIFFSVYTCAARYSYSDIEPYAFHVLSLDKINLRDEETLFLVPPLSPLADMVADGEWHHAHSRLGISIPPFDNPETTYKLHGQFFKDHHGFILNPFKKSIEIVIDLYSLSCKNAKILKYNKNVIGFKNDQIDRNFINDHQYVLKHMGKI